MTKAEKRILLLLSLAQLILTLDSTVMNVSITTLVKDLSTTVAGVQSAITFYSLVMAAFMIAGAKVGDIIGRKKAFVVGLVVYGLGSFITALAPNITVLKIGWSLLEGLGAALVIPAMISLISSNFAAGPRRIKAYGTWAAMAAIGTGIGPIVGGVLTTYASWRWAFAGEVLIVVYILLNRAVIVDAKLEGAKPRLDWLGVGLSASAMAVIVQGVLMASTYGLMRARQDWVVVGKTLVTTGGISPTIYLVTAGLCIMALFAVWESYRLQSKRDVLLHLRLLKNKIVTSGMGAVFAIQFVLAGTMYSLALYLQLELGYNAMATGVAMLPLSVMILVLASRGPKYSAKFAPRLIVQVGFVVTVLGVIWLGIKSGDVRDGLALLPALALVGAGTGLIVSQLQNLVQSSVTQQDSAEASGLFATFQYFGASVGTAMSGVLLIGVLIAASNQAIEANTTLNAAQKAQLTSAYDSKAQIASNAQVESLVAAQPPELAQAVVDINATARQQALSATFVLLGILGALGLISTRHLPAGKPKPV